MEVHRNKRKGKKEMLNQEKKVTIELVNENGEMTRENTKMSCPITDRFSDSDKLSLMIAKILHEELPMLKNNSLLYNLVLYSISEKMKTVQTVENVLSCIKEANAKTVEDVSFKNGEVCIKCSI